MRRTHKLSVVLWLAAIAAAIGRADTDALVSDQLSLGLTEFEVAQQIQREQPDRAKKLFFSAASRMKNVVASGITNGRLEYNIGNAYLQGGDVGRAILHYRRAERLIPGDPLLKDNLELARSKRLTHISPTARDQFVAGLLFWHNGTTQAQRTYAAMAFYGAGWALLAIWIWRRRTLLAVAGGIALSLAAACGASVAAAHWSDRDSPDGVILAMDVPVYKGPGQSYQRQFEQPLQPGVEFILRERRGDSARGDESWWKIELADGKAGWVAAADAELVPLAYSQGFQLPPEYLPMLQAPASPD